MPILDQHILYEDAHLVAINKPSGYLVEASAKEKTALEEMLSAFLSEKHHQTIQVRAVHRLDRRVSGLLLFAKTSEALAGMIALFKAKQVKKTYWAIVANRPAIPSDTLVHWLTRDKEQNITFTHNEPQAHSVEATLAYRLLEEANHFFLIEVFPFTGRTHQIRAQLAAIGCPIVGDYKYGFPREKPRKAIALHAKQLRFTHPISQQPISLEAAIPDAQLWNSFRHASAALDNDKRSSE
ncbi:RluA family pseudouridine synthase [Olivibacter sp. XZL3]|uniref:RluA family pseudouridine synthase n=1 Tax=Olivibacter sp. XZL3 TaxID=1735116 RepID=UPI00106489FA|nr:RNA pseudouridine synthase [Olivibacter sp. XZL3]